MASVLSEATSSSTTTAINSPVVLSPFHLRPTGVGYLASERSYLLGDEPSQGQVRLNKFVAEAFHGESPLEFRNAELGRAAKRALEKFEINQGREKRAKTVVVTQTIDENMADMQVEDEWGRIQDYGDFLRQTADTFRSDMLTPPERRITRSPPENARRSNESSSISPFDWLSWRNFRFNGVFAHLAPLTAHENRIYARQCTKLIDWIANSINDVLFPGWAGLDQVVDIQRTSEDAHHRREAAELEALERILEDSDEKSTDIPTVGPPELGWRPIDGHRTQTSFAKYLSQEAPQIFPPQVHARVTSTEPSRSSSMGGSDDDTRSVVSQDNHWRRTIFG